MLEAVKLYRRAAELDDASHEAAYNLAQSLVDYADMLDDGAADGDPSIDVESQAAASWEEARTLLLRTEAMQRAVLVQDGTMDDGDDGASESSVMEASGQFEVGQVVVPSVIIDTLLAFIDATLSLHTESRDANRRATLWTDMSEAIARAKALDQQCSPAGLRAVDIALAEASALVARVESDFDLAGRGADSPPNLVALQHAIETLLAVVAADRTVESLSALADARSTAAELMLRHLFAKSSEPRMSQAESDADGFTYAMSLLSEAFTDYDALRAMLEAPMLSRDPSVKRIPACVRSLRRR